MAAIPACKDVKVDASESKDIPIVLVAITTLTLPLDTSSMLANSVCIAPAASGALTKARGFAALRPKNPVITGSGAGAGLLVITAHSGSGGVHESVDAASQWHLLVGLEASASSVNSAPYDAGTSGHA